MALRAHRSLVLCLVAALVAVLLVPLPSATPPAEAADPDWIITLDADGASTSWTHVRAGQEVTWRNRSGGDLTITGAGGAFDSGPIPDGGSYLVDLDRGGTYEWETAVASGVIMVTMELTTSSWDDRPVEETIPDLAFPPRPEGDLGVHPDLGIRASMSRALVTFVPGTRADDAQDVLDDERVDVIGGLPTLGILLVTPTYQPRDHRAITRIVDELRGHAEVEAASLELIEEPAATPPPASDAFIDRWAWYWDALSTTEGVGAGANWTHELTRAPLGWNLREAIERAGGTRPTTVVVDSGFEAHEDLSRLQILELCQNRVATSQGDTVADTCTSDRAGDHGNHVAGIVGADLGDLDDPSGGVVGADPVGPLLGLSNHVTGPTGRTGYEAAAIFTTYELLLREISAGRLGDVRVINHSTAFDINGEDWRDAHAGETCGPGLADDDAGSGVCYPDTEDTFLRETTEYGKVMRRVVQRFSSELPTTPLFVVAAGNDGAELCPGLAASCEEHRPPQTAAMTSMSWTAANWLDEAGPNPVLVVESIGQLVKNEGSDTSSPVPNRHRSGFSNVGGDISAPGLAVSAESSEDGKSCNGGANDYCYQQGTSQAAPLVAGIAGVMADVDPTLDGPTLRQRLLAWAQADTDGGAAPRADAYLPVLATAGAARMVADVNDPSADGNRRVVTPAADGADPVLDETLSSVAGRGTDPDGVIDMRDFRRFRDAWLARCLLDPEQGCPDDIALDGPADHPKRDLNLDGCIGWYLPQTMQDCPSELTFPRFDLNGDGTISRTATGPVGLRADGTPAAGPAEAAQLRDLDVLASQWDADEPGAQGLQAGDLEALMTSGDLVINGDGLDQTGADAVDLVIRDTEQDATVFNGSLTLGGDPGIATVQSGRDLAIDVYADGPTAEPSFTVDTAALDAGEDRHVDLCGALSLDVDPDQLRPDDGTATVTATVTACGGDAAGVTVDLALGPTGVTDGAALTASSIVTDADGIAITTVDAGTVMNDYEIHAAADIEVAPGIVVTRTARARLRVAEPYTFEVVADDGTGSAQGYEWLRDSCPGDPEHDGCLVPPSVNRDGDVAFRATVFGRDSESVMVAGDTVDPLDPASAIDLTADQLPAGSWIHSAPRINDDGEVVAGVTEVVSFSRQRSWIHRLHTIQPGTVTEVAFASTDASENAPFERVTCPDVNAAGEVVFAADLDDGSRVVVRPDADGYRWGLGTAAACPDFAVDGTTTMSSAQPTGETDDRGFPIYESLVLVGDDVQQDRYALAAAGQDGWQDVSEPAIADSGQGIAFSGDRGEGGGIWLSLRTGADLASWSTPRLVAGANDVAPRAELGHGDDGTPRYLADVADHESGDDLTYGSGGGVATAHLERAPAGLAGDRFVLAFLATPNDAGDGFTERPGLWTVAVDVVADTAAPDGLALDVHRPVAVAQLGQTLAGGVLEEFAIGDALAIPTSPSSPDDHVVVFAAESDPAGTDPDRAVLVRARAYTGPGQVTAATTAAVQAAPAPEEEPPSDDEGTDTEGTDTEGTEVDPDADGGEDDGGGLSAQTFAAATAAAPPEFEAFDAPHVAAITIPDDQPVQGVPFTVVNRSRTLDGRAAWAVLDANMDSFSLNKYDGGMPVLLEPDGSAEIVNPEGDGNWPLVLSAPVVSTGAVSQLRFSVDVQRPPNRPAVVDLGGPYTIANGADLEIRYDVDDDAYWSERYGNVELDLDGDGVYDDGSQGVRSSRIDISAERVRQEICGGTCAEDVPYTIGVEVTDTDGAVTTASTTVTISGTQDFTLDVQPVTLPVNPGETGIAYARIRSVDGFDGPVGIEVEGVPDDWRVSTARADDAPTDLRITVRVPDDTPEQLFDLEVVARSGELEHRDTFTVSTVFGLIEQCTVDVAINVTDSETGDPIEGARITSLWPYRYTDQDGHYAYSHTLREGYLIQEHRVWVDAGGYRAARQDRVLGCEDEETTFDVVLEPIPTASVEGDVVVGRPNPWRHGSPAPTSTPIEGATVRVRTGNTTVDVTETDDLGDFASQDTILVPGDTQRVSVQASAEGYWSNTAYGEVAPDQRLDVGNIALLEQCHGTLGGGRVVDQHGDPVANSRVTAEGGGDVTTDEDGHFWFGTEDLLLAHSNRPRSIRITARAPAEWDEWVTTRRSAVLGGCDEVSDDVTLVLNRPPPPPEENYGDLEVRVVDAVTGDPIPDAFVRGKSVDDDGRISFTDIFVGYDDDITRDYSVRTTAAGYYRHYGQVTLEADQTVETTIELTAREYGRMEGRVLDSETGEPVEGALVRIQPDGFYGTRAYGTDDQGRYVFDDLDLLEPNQATNYDLYAQKKDPDTGRYVYWPGRIQDITVEPGGTAVQDIELLRVCEGGTIRGTVVDASTLEPLEDVTIRVSGDGRTWHTDEDGEFELPNIRPDTDNEPNDVRVSASKSGYFSAARNITIFCGADIRLDFGTPDAGFGTVVGTVTDVDGVPLEGVFVGSGYGGATETDANGEYVLDDAPVAPDGSPRDWTITAQGDPGEASATVTVTKDEEVRQDFVLGADNDPPTADDRVADTVAGAAVSVALDGDDPDGDPISYTILSQPVHGTLDGDGAVWTYTPDDGFVGEDSFTYAAQDAAATSAPATVTITVAPVPNEPPTLVVPGDLSITAGKSLTLPIAADDPDGDPVTLAGDDLPGWARLADGGDGTGTVELDTSADHAGSSAELTVVASDGTEEVRDRFTVDVTPPPDPNGAPTARLAVDEPVPEGSPIVLDASESSDPDDDDLAHVWSIDGQRHRGAVVEVPTVDDGMHPVVLRVEDGAGGEHRIQRTVRVANVAPAVLVEQVDPGVVEDLRAQVAPGQHVEVVARVSDPGTADTHTARIDWGDGTDDDVVVQDGRLRARHAYGAGGQHTVTVDVCDDDGGCGREHLQVVVAGASDAQGVQGGQADGAPDAPAATDGPAGVTRHAPTGIPAAWLLLIGLLSIGFGAPLTRWPPRGRGGPRR